MEEPSAPAEDESDEDDMFLRPPPSVGDDAEVAGVVVGTLADEESRSSFAQNSKASLADGDATMGSPGVREVVSGDSKSGTPDPSEFAGRRNKRKNFRPRNIVHSHDGEDELDSDAAAVHLHNNNNVHDAEDEGDAEEERGSSTPTSTAMPLNLSGSASPLLSRISLLPRKLDMDQASSSPMDLSLSEPAKSPVGLSVARPEILFAGDKSEEAQKDHREENGEGEVREEASSPPPPPFPPPFLALGLAAAAAAASGNGGGPTAGLAGLANLMAANSSSQSSLPAPQAQQEGMREAFLEVLKLYGLPKDIAETIARNSHSSGESRARTQPMVAK